ncbi:MAG: CBS domain-containing protein [Methanobacteriota archaeon]|jgi:CBS domain-containing protein|uniref:CBS domain-containing protein n=1 Tax=Halorutilus salinus TaxID=2487751 RepID=A0A9Q4GI86_9EURY|nr:CBS domain-containing protein [Halorutilus salinus]MCX2819605.1 CBS domain-containing protein [Halorutilus salinus]
MPTVDEIARDAEDVVTSPSDETVRELAETMRDENVGSVVVIEDGEPVGIVTDRDITVRGVAKENDPDNTTAGDVMTGDLVVVNAHDEITELIETLDAAGVRRMPVVDGDEIAGIVTLDDIAVLLAVELDGIAEEMTSLSNVIRSGSPPY